MTGEMSWINENGNDSNGDCYELHATVAKAINGQLKPFDVYQGPYIVVGPDVRLGNSPYAVAPTGLGIIRLWLIREDDLFKWYREDTVTKSFEFFWDDNEIAIEAAKSLL